MPKALDSSPVPLEDRPERGGIALRPHPQPAIEIALRPEILRGDEHAPASPEGAGEHDGRSIPVTIERDVHPARRNSGSAALEIHNATVNHVRTGYTAKFHW